MKRWTAKRKAALILDLIKGTTTVAQAARTYDLTPAEIEEWLEEGLRGMENNLRSHPKDVAEQYESQIKDLQAKVGELVLEVDVLKKPSVCSANSLRNKGLQADLLKEGRKVSIKRICRILGLLRRSFYYKPRERRIPLNPDKVQKVSDCIEKFPTYGYRRIALLMNENRKVFQRIL